jgi:CIC family chloride channel protein
MIEPGRWFQPMNRPDRTGSDELAVLDEAQQLLGVLSEAYATRRYAEELEKNRRDLVGGE